MELKKLTFAALIAASLGGLYGCSEGDEASIVIDSVTNVNGDSNGGISQGCPSWTTPKAATAAGKSVCALPSVILEDRNLTADIDWLMEGRVTVGNGNEEMSATEGLLASGDAVAEVELTVAPGTQIKASTGSFANLIITRGSKIFARGTATAPIVFSSDDDGLDGTGEWGGLIIHGYGEHNECPGVGTACNIDSEGESGFAGGYTADDNSGIVQYVVVTEGGFEFAPGNEINGISMIGVGSGTVMDHIQVNSNADDGVEFYGGAINVSHVVLTGNLDDSVDWDEGYTGNLQYVIVKQSANTAGNAVEADTEGSATGFLSNPVVMNATYIGNGSKDTLHVLKARSAGIFLNSVMTFDATSTATPTTCVNADAGSLADIVYDNIIGDCDSFTTAASSGLTTGRSIDAVAADLNALNASQAAEAVLAAAIDLTPFATADTDFLEDTLYIGAVDPAATSAWYEGWIVDGSL